MPHARHTRLSLEMSSVILMHREKDENKPCFAALVAQVKEAKVNKVRDFSREPGYEGHVQAFNTANQPVNSTC